MELDVDDNPTFRSAAPTFKTAPLTRQLGIALIAIPMLLATVWFLAKPSTTSTQQARAPWRVRFSELERRCQIEVDKGARSTALQELNSLSFGLTESNESQAHAILDEFEAHWLPIAKQ